MSSATAIAQTAAEPAGELPEVQVIQKKAAPAKPAPKQKKAAAKKKQAPAPAPAAAPVPVPASSDQAEAIDVEPPKQNPVYGAVNSGGAAARAEQSAQTPVNPVQLIPDNLEGFAGAATRVTTSEIEERQPRNINDVFARVPGVIVINDDANGHHGGLGVRGSPARRSRKLLVMEDGHAVNLALWLDPSVHYWGPLERFESIEVLRGSSMITHGPNNNFGVINARNLSPFGPNETVVSSAIGFTKSRTGFYEDEDGEIRTGGNDLDISARWHVHTRQTAGNVGVVFSYTGANVQGAWDTERLRFNDFYGAIGWKGVDQDLTVSVMHGRQRDNYDELNVIGDEDDGEPGEAEEAFFDLKHCKSCYAPGSVNDKYYGDIWRSQIVHNNYVDDNTTITTRLYGGHHRRDRYQIIGSESDPDGDLGLPPIADFDDGEVLLGEDTMFGRLRTFRHIGTEVRAEFANRPFFGGLTQDIQTGIRYEYQDMSNRNFLGVDGEILRDGDKDGLTIFDRSLKANTVSAFLQTSIKATKNFSVVPGVRLEWYDIERRNRVIAEEESEAEEADEDDCEAAGFGGECLELEGINFDPHSRDSTSSFIALPGIGFSYTGFYRTTLFGSYYRGMSTGVLRNEDFPIDDEIGNNFELGLRSGAFRGTEFEIVGFYKRIEDYQFGASFSNAGDRVFGRADDVEISGVELAGRINSQPFTGGPYNLYGEANYTYSRGIFKKGSKEDEDTGDIIDFAGNHLPEVPFHVAALTLGLQKTTGWRWDASVTYTYRGSFYTDEDNSAYGSDPEGENGEVPDIWLLSARFNLDIGNSGASLFVAGDNLTDEFYITDREDGLKPGLGRTIWTGFKYKF
jgi:Fe(3+) dicitrate transport protein